MDWASNIFIVLLITDITGTIFFLVGEVIRKLADKDVTFLRFLTEVTTAAYLVPFFYIILYLEKRITIIRNESGINLFYSTPRTLQLTAVLGWIWIGLFLILLVRRMIRALRLVRLCRGNIPEEDETVFRVFTDICAEFGIEGKVSLCRNDSIDVACVTYYHGYVVMLPLVKYTEKEAEVIICHELCHYLNHDLWLKMISRLAALLHVFNPTVHILLKRTGELCEIYCDRVASKKGEYMFSEREYFQVIFDSLLKDGKKNRYRLFALADDAKDYERRVKYMANYRAKGGLKRGTAVVLAACFLLGSSITSLAAGDGVAEAYMGLADATNEWTGEDGYSEFNKLIEMSEAFEVKEEFVQEYNLDPETVVIMDDGIAPLSDEEAWHIIWNIPPRRTYMSSGFRENEGDVVGVMVIGTPDDIVFRTGIKDPDYLLRYIEGNEMLMHTFAIDKDGRHYFFVSNWSETEELHIEAYIYK